MMDYSKKAVRNLLAGHDQFPLTELVSALNIIAGYAEGAVAARRMKRFEALDLTRSVTKCFEATNDRDAELVRAGFQLAFSARNLIYRTILKSNLSKGMETRRANQETRDSSMAHSYRRLEPGIYI